MILSVIHVRTVANVFNAGKIVDAGHVGAAFLLLADVQNVVKTSPSFGVRLRRQQSREVQDGKRGPGRPAGGRRSVRQPSDSTDVPTKPLRRLVAGQDAVVVDAVEVV